MRASDFEVILVWNEFKEYIIILINNTSPQTLLSHLPSSLSIASPLLDRFFPIPVPLYSQITASTSKSKEQWLNRAITE